MAPLKHWFTASGKVPTKWEVGIPNAKQYPVHQHTNTVFEHLWDIMRYLSCQTKMATPSSELECDTYASMPTACQTKRPLSMTKWGLLVMLTISEIIYQPWPCTSSPRWICKILCTWNPPQWRCFVDFLRGNKTCQEILCAYYISLHYMYACMHSAYVLKCAHDSDTIIWIQFMLICICSCVWVWWENAKWLSNDYRNVYKSRT